MKPASILLVDCPWQFDNVNTGGTFTSGANEKYEGTLSVKDLAALAVPAITAPNAVMFHWVVESMQEEGLAVARAWGFRVVTSFTWKKLYKGNRMGMGFWHRGGIERMLLCVKGNVTPFGLQRPGWFEADVGEHSAKPPISIQIVDECAALSKFSTPQKVELFARETRPGWTSLGNEIDGKDIRVALRDLAMEIHR